MNNIEISEGKVSEIRPCFVSIKGLCEKETLSIVELMKRVRGGEGCRLTNRNLAHFSLDQLSVLTIEMFDQLYSCKSLLSKSLPESLDMLSDQLLDLENTVTCLKTNEILVKYDSNIVKAGSIIEKIEPLLQRVSVLDQRFTEFKETSKLQVEELCALKTAVTTTNSKQATPPPPPVLDYTKIKFPPQPTTQPGAIRKEVRNMQRKNNIIIRGLTSNQTISAMSVVNSFLENSNIVPFTSARSQVVSAHYLKKAGEGVSPIRVVLHKPWSAEELLRDAHKLKQGTEAYRQVYLSPDRSPVELEKHKKLVTEMRRKITEEPTKRWIIQNGDVVQKGIYKP